ncbi:MAG: PIN domain-containing protein [Nanoarchaeota archaeon]|nr:PIN domain-containing protein [Nanoarchaeota archaeon]MBU1623136.1 PIN domain-containing protein [Nanoarchaeota archaeon]MBU1973842.1 PIN domain-containing protein [Nanoarchaeota archaeon]
MQVVIDANIIIAMLIKPGKSIDIFFREELEIFAPELLFKELENNKAIIVKKSKISEKEINQLLTILKQKILIVPEDEFVRFKEKAEIICPDPKDIVYFALALYINCAIWTNEKKLKEQGKITIYATHELINTFNQSLFPIKLYILAILK